MKNAKTVTLARVSSRSQEDGYSLDSQGKLLRSYCHENGMSLIREFRLSETASKNERRKVFQEMLGFVKKRKIDHLVVEKTDRLTRNFRDAVVIDDWLEAEESRRLHMVKEGLIIHKNAKSDAKLMWNIYLAFAKKYTDNLREEAMKGWDEKLAQGWMPAPPPPGYKTVTERGRKIHTIDEDTAFMIERAFKYFLQPEGCVRSVTEELKMCGLTTRKNNPHVESSVHRMLSNKFYIGTIQFNGQEYPGAHEPLIDEELFNAVQTKLKRNTRPRTQISNFLFRGLIICSVCNGLVSWQKQKGRAYGSCQRWHDDCKRHSFLREDRVESAVLASFEDISDSNGMLFERLKQKLIERRSPFSEGNIEDMHKLLTTQLRRIETMQDGVYEDKLLGAINDKTYLRKSNQFRERTIKIEKHLDELSRYRDEIEQTTIRQSRHALRNLYMQSSKPEKRIILEKLFKITARQGTVQVDVVAVS